MFKITSQGRRGGGPGGRTAGRPARGRARDRMPFVNLESSPWKLRSKLCPRKKSSGAFGLLERVVGPARNMAAIEAEGFTIKAGMKNSQV